MPKLYVANVKQQIEQFTYWLPEGKRSMIQSIDICSQVLVSGRDLPINSIEAIIQSKTPYGLVEFKEALKSQGRFSGMAYKLDKSFTYDDLQHLRNRYEGVLVRLGEDQRAAAAVAANQFLNDKLFETAAQQGREPPRVDAYEMHIEEMEKPAGDDTPELNAKVRVERPQGEPRPTVRKRRT